MVKIIIILSIFSLLLLFLNISLIWYIKKTTASLLFVSENLYFLKESTNSFSNHIKSVSELDMFYGDETIGFLIEHAVALQDRISEFNDIIQLSEEQEIILDDREIKIEEELDQASQGSPSTPQTLRTTKEKHVLYGGSRRGNN
jgi:hypothetical protein